MLAFTQHESHYMPSFVQNQFRYTVMLYSCYRFDEMKDEACVIFLLVKLPYLSPTLSESSKVLIAPSGASSSSSSFAPLYARSLYEMSRCVWWKIGHLVSTCFFLHFSQATRPQPQAPLAQQVQQTNHDRLGAVASENKICSQIGINLLEAGGNAVDAVGSRN